MNRVCDSVDPALGIDVVQKPLKRLALCIDNYMCVEWCEDSCTGESMDTLDIYEDGVIECRR